MSKISLWPEEITQEVGITGPAGILKEQAAQLGQKTKNLVKAEVIAIVGHNEDGQDYFDRFVVQGPIIGYVYQLFTVAYPIDFYPAIVRADLPSLGGVLVQDEENFIKTLGEIFSHPKTIKVIQAIIARSKQEQPDDDFDDSYPDE